MAEDASAEIAQYLADSQPATSDQTLDAPIPADAQIPTDDATTTPDPAATTTPDPTATATPTPETVQ